MGLTALSTAPKSDRLLISKKDVQEVKAQRNMSKGAVMDDKGKRVHASIGNVSFRLMKCLMQHN